MSQHTAPDHTDHTGDVDHTGDTDHAGGPDQAAGPHPPAVYVAQLWDAVAAGNEYAATDIVLTALDAGLPAEDVLLEVIAPVQAKVGAEWAANRINVAQEHTATAINDRAVAALAQHSAIRRSDVGTLRHTAAQQETARRAARYAAGHAVTCTVPTARTRPDAPAARGRITVACVDGEWHALPARILSEVLKLRGWQVDYLGAQVPTPHLISHLHRSATHVVALSSSIATRLPTAHATITACQATGVPVLVGGAAFGPEGRYARLLGADAWAPDARAAADLLDADRLPGPLHGHQPMDDLPHLADQEYTMVARTHAELVKATFTGLEERYPAMRTYTDRQREHTAEDLAQIVSFLASALYTDDPELFTGFLLWTAGILEARGVPAASLHPTLDLLGEELRDFPRATRLLSLAADALMSR
ncbi:cobalamin-binding protein [Streptomyces spiroverticillatus]|uniref:Cobalamin-binding protein n=1 Tax=Streptomyces finlayi TaxID=67296 RepID=A0A919CCB2_9ACTN|nr:cobalamin B12-binding domain-containing protein [Streptomyces finlayi]GHA22448.1 cobalamin-binding protein [Streptomyces spiroverticillatus]GHD04404.1 cobalamin-binding protein [Streptomyces finlayi]